MADANQTPQAAPAEQAQPMQVGIAKIPNPPGENERLITGDSIYLSGAAFASAQRFAGALASSSMVPSEYKNNLANCMVALEYAARTRTSPLMVMQNMHIIDGKPNWSSKFKIAALNSCGRFTPLRFAYGEDGTARPEFVGGLKIPDSQVKDIPNLTCFAYATDRETGEKVVGPVISIQTAISEGWYSRKGSKWPNMAQLMLTYRAASMFGNIYATDILLGMQSEEEAYDSREAYPLQATSGAAGGTQAVAAVAEAANAAIAQRSAPQAATAGEARKGPGRPRTRGVSAEDATVISETPAPAVTNPVVAANAAISRPAPLANNEGFDNEGEEDEAPKAGPNQVPLWDEEPAAAFPPGTVNY